MTSDLADPTTATLAVADALRAAQIPGVVYGGLALGAYGEPRETKDADFAVVATPVATVLAALERAGVEASVSFDAVRFGGVRITRILLLAAPDASGLNVLDLVEPLSMDYGRRMLSRGLTGSMRGTEVSLVSPEDFVVLKVLSTRERDLEDAASVMRRLREHVDRGLVEREIDELAALIDDHPIRARYERVREAARAG
ncbi:MAG: nucleotidyltransferase [Sandaracinaceae bacterium]|nr:nucleotidyltransferase [Sandaracinaceae bacterium]